MDWTFFNSNLHFAELKSWWEYWGSSTVFDEGVLSTTGVIITKNNINLCSGWLYRSDSDLGYVGFIIMNPKANREDRIGCIEYLLDVLGMLAKKYGIRILFASIENKNLVDRMVRNGFMVSGNSTNLIKLL
jgi:hypothetical protein